jgi:hypothetical protein
VVIAVLDAVEEGVEAGVGFRGGERRDDEEETHQGQSAHIGIDVGKGDFVQRRTGGRTTLQAVALRVDNAKGEWRSLAS